MSMNNKDKQILEMWRNGEFDTVTCHEDGKEYKIVAFIEFVSSERKGISVFTYRDTYNYYLNSVIYKDGKLYELDDCIGGRLNDLGDRFIRHYNSITGQEGGYISKVHYKDHTKKYYSEEEVSEDPYKEVDTEKELEEQMMDLMMKMCVKMDKMTDLILSGWDKLNNINMISNLLSILEKMYKYDVIDHNDYIYNLKFLLNLQDLDLDNGKLVKINTNKTDNDYTNTQAEKLAEMVKKYNK